MGLSPEPEHRRYLHLNRHFLKVGDIYDLYYLLWDYRRCLIIGDTPILIFLSAIYIYI